MVNRKSESVWITHTVNPHQFYFKYTGDIANSEFSKFDFEIQLYGNELYAQHKNKKDEHGYVPVENELVLFYHVIYNKWIRGRVVSLVGQEITFWCIDNGIWEKWSAPSVLPLTERFHEDMKLVHLGGLSLLPTEKILNVETVDVETHLSNEWDIEAISMFKRIIGTSKTFTFTEEFQLENHKFGSLVIESKSGTKEINKILLAMHKTAPSDQYTDEDLCDHVHVARLENQLHHSIVHNSLLPTANSLNISTKSQNRSSIKSGSVMSNEDFDDSLSRQSFTDISTVVEPPRPALIIDRREACQSDVLKYENANRNDVSSSTAESEWLDDDDDHEDHDDDDSVNEISSSTDIAQNVLNLLNVENYLHKCKTQFTENVRRKPLESTVAWIELMCKSKSFDNKPCARNIANLNDNRCSQKSTAKSSTASRSHRSMLDAIARKEPAKIVNNNSAIGGKRFGIPAGYAKNDLDSFGGLNKNSEK